MWLYFLLLLGFLLRKILDQRRSSRNLHLLRQRRTIPSRDRAMPWLFLTHVVFFALIPSEIVLLERGFIPWLGVPMMVLFVLAALLRWWSTRLLGAYWNSHITVPEDLQPVTHGPYRIIRHPNYLGMSVELISLSLIYSAFLSAS